MAAFPRLLSVRRQPRYDLVDLIAGLGAGDPVGIVPHIGICAGGVFLPTAWPIGHQSDQFGRARLDPDQRAAAIALAGIGAFIGSGAKLPRADTKFIFLEIRIGVAVGFGISAGATIASVKLKTTRAIAASGLSEFASSAQTGTALQVFGEVGYTFGDTHASVEPFAGLALSRLKLGDNGESGGVSSIRTNGRDYALTLADIGLRGHFRLTPGEKRSVDLEATLAIQQVVGGRTLSSDIAFASAPALNFAIATIAQHQTAFAPDIGLYADLGVGASINLSYSGVIGARTRDHGVKASVLVRF